MERIRFDQMDLTKEIQKAVKEMGFEEATSIQTTSIPLIKEGRDVIGHSQTGTGKTAAFGIPAIEMVDTSSKDLQVLILCPTRELAIQACDELRKFGKYKHGVKILPIYGGQAIDGQIRSLKQGVQIIIGTPGRVMDHMRRRTIRTSTIKLLVLDEADEMLNMGFREDLDIIIKDIPETRQTILFSATMSKEILQITKLYLKDPEILRITHKQLTVPSIEQFYFEVKQTNKIETLCNLIDIYNPKLSLVFCNTKKMVETLVSELQLRGYLANGIQGDMKQSSRTRVMDMFKKGKIDILVATDVAARGIDVENIEAVFNYDVPQDEEYYVHRIGRTGRAGKSGNAYTFVTGRREMTQLKDIQRYTNAQIFYKNLPTMKDAEEFKVSKLIGEITKVLDEGDIEKYAPVLEKLTKDEFTSADVAMSLIKMMMEKDKVAKEPQVEEDYESSGGEPGMVRLFINAGKLQKITTKDILGAVANESGIRGNLVGKIKVLDNYSFVEVPTEKVQVVLSSMKNTQIKGKKINIETARGR